MNALLLALIIPALPNVDPPYPETSTNIAIAVNMARLDMVSFALNMSQPASNEVVVAVGRDADNDGDLSFGEAAFIFGCDDGMNYYADLSTGSVRFSCNHKITKNDIIHFTNDLLYEVFGYTLHGTRVWQEVDGYIVENILAELRGQTVAAFSNSNSELQLYKNELR